MSLLSFQRTNDFTTNEADLQLTENIVNKSLTRCKTQTFTAGAGPNCVRYAQMNCLESVCPMFSCNAERLCTLASQLNSFPITLVKYWKHMIQTMFHLIFLW